MAADTHSHETKPLRLRWLGKLIVVTASLHLTVACFALWIDPSSSWASLFGFPLQATGNIPACSTWASGIRYLLTSLTFGCWVGGFVWIAWLMKPSWRSYVLAFAMAFSLWWFGWFFEVLPLSEPDNQILGLFGTWLAIVGFAITIVQLIEAKKLSASAREMARKAQTASEAARDAARAASEKARERFRDYSVPNTNRLVILARNCVDEEFKKITKDRRWDTVKALLDLVVEQLRYIELCLDGGDRGQLATEIRDIISGIRKSQADFTSGRRQDAVKDEWSLVIWGLQDKLAILSSPVRPEQE